MNMNKLIRIIFCQIIFIAALNHENALATQPYTPKVVNPLLESSRWNKFSELDGQAIRFMAEGPNKQIWISSSEGILSYDGYSWTNHEGYKEVTQKLADHILLHDDIVYVTNSDGIFKLENDKWSSHFNTSKIENFEFFHLTQILDNKIAASTNYGVFILQNEEIKLITSHRKRKILENYYQNITYIEFPEHENIDFISVSNVLVKNNDIWIAITKTEEVGELLKINKTAIEDGKITTFRKWENNNDLRLGENQKLLLTHNNDIWVINSTSNKSLAIYNGIEWKTVAMSKMFGGDEYMSDIVQTDDGTIWISSMAAFFAYRNGEWQKYRAPNFPVPANSLILQKGSDNEIWIAGYKSNMVVIDFDLSRHISYEDLSYYCTDNEGTEWFLSEDNKVVTHKNGLWNAYDSEDGLIDMPISILHTSKDQIWVTGSENGKAATALLKNNKWEKHIHDKLSWTIDYRAAYESKNGTLWFGAGVDADKEDGYYSGVLELPNPTEENLNWIHHRANENGLSQSNVYGIGESIDGRIWIGGTRLLNYNGKEWQTIEEEKLNQYINVITNTDDLLIVGSRYYGIFIYDGKTWENHTTIDGLPSNTVISIEVINSKNIIVATENGICRYDGKNWTKHIFPEEYNLDFEGGSIVSLNQNTFWINHVPRNWKRRAYQKNNKTQNEWDIHTIFYKAEGHPPETQINFYQKEVSSQGKALISWSGEDYFSKTPTSNLTYSYKADDNDWSPFTTSTQYSFEGLKNGMHTLKVRARDSDFNVDPTPAEVEFKVLSPVWKSPWFIFLISSFIILFGFFEYRILSERRKLQVLNANLMEANNKLEIKRKKNEIQNKEILRQQDQIVKQSNELELYNIGLESRNKEIKEQRDQLEVLVKEIEELSKAKVSFFTNISHELRTPLSLILGPIEQLRLNNKEIQPNDKNKLYSIINKNALRLFKLINQLLEIRRIEESTLEIKNTNIELDQHIKEIVSLFENLALRRNIKLKLKRNIKKEIVSIDADKLEKILVNLLSNAFKHTPDGGRISITLDIVSHKSNTNTKTSSSYIQFKVQDNGEGIKAENIEHIFEKFYTSKENSLNHINSGVGLNYVNDLTYLMNGNINVKSNSEFTEFIVQLPYTPARVKAETTKPYLGTTKQEIEFLLESYLDTVTDHNLTDEKLPNILIIDDNKEMLDFLENILQKEYNVFKSEDGFQGLQIANNIDIDLIICDVMMPRMDGFKFLENIRNNLNTSHIPTIILSAKVLDESKLLGFNLGTDDYISKPFKVELLLSRIKNLLKQRRSLRDIYIKEYILTPKEEKIVSQDEELLQKLSKAMEENYNDSSFNVDSMCKIAYLSHMHFIRKIKQLTGKKPIDLLKSYRMKKAKEMLAQKKLSIAEISYKVGFDLPNSFSRAFKKEFNISPTQYIIQLEEEQQKYNLN